MTKLDPLLQAQLQSLRLRAASPEERPALRAAAAEPDEPVRVIVKFTGDLAELTAVGFRPGTVGSLPPGQPHIVTGTAPPSRLDDLAAIEHVVWIDAPHQRHPMLDYSVPQIRADRVRNGSPSRKGKNVVIGIIDSGIDWRHADFLDWDGRSSRIFAIWDQLLLPNPGDKVGPKGYGVLYDQGDLDLAVQGTKPIRSLDLGIAPHRDDDHSKGHGTHVAGIAAGSGDAATCCHARGTYVGVAPLAQIVMVRSNFYDDRLIDGINFILEQAIAAGKDDGFPDGKPVVINMSLGGLVGSHDGTSAVEQHINQVLRARPGRAIVVAAGNSGDVEATPCHVAATVPANGEVEVRFATGDDLPGAAFVDLWYERAGELNATLTSPSTTVIGPANHGGGVGPVPANPAAAVDRQAMVQLRSRINDADGRDNNLLVTIAKPTTGSVPRGTWRLRLRNPRPAPVSFHAWCEPDYRVVFARPVDPPDGVIRASAASTVTIPGTAAEAITVANHQQVTGDCDCRRLSGIVPSSSRGPVVRNAATNPKPDIAAPGLEITATAADAATLRGACCDCLPDACCVLYVDKTGTSMAAPHVTGTVALMLEEDPTLTSAKIKEYLRASTDDAPAPADENTWGKGKLNAEKAVLAVRAAKGGGGPSPAPPGGGGGGPNPPRFGGTAFRDVTAPGPLRGFGPHRHGPVPTGFLLLREQLATFPDGERLAAVASRHFSEVRRLINTNRKVAAMWHQAGGPALLRGMLSCGAHTCRVEVDERRVRYLSRFAGQLEQHASPRLRAALAEHGTTLLAVLLNSAAAA